MQHSVMAASRILIALALFGSITGCASQAEEPGPEPKVVPPAIAAEGVLKAGVDLEYPPFAGEDQGREAGLDIDVAAAIASRLGLELELVQVAPSEAATALASGLADIVLSVPLAQDAVSSVSLAGTYIHDGAGFFVKGSESSATVESTETTPPAVPQLGLGDLRGKRVAVQKGSVAYWSLLYDLGDAALTVFPTLRDAVIALDGGDADVVVGDALVTAYIGRDFPLVKFAGPYGPAIPLAVAVRQDNPDLEVSVRETLDDMAADGVLDRIRATWLGELPELEAAVVD